MTEERRSYGNTDGSNISLPLRGMVECVVSAAGLLSMFTTYSGAAGITTIAENTTTTLSAYAGDVTHMDTSD